MMSDLVERFCEESAVERLYKEGVLKAQGEPVPQFRKCGCSDWYDGLPDESDGGGPYETRTLYTSAHDDGKPKGEPVAWDIYEYRKYGAPGEAAHRVIWVEHYEGTRDLEWLLGKIREADTTISVRPLYLEA